MCTVERELMPVCVNVFGTVREILGVLVPNDERIRGARKDLVEELWIRAVMTFETLLDRIHEDRDATFSYDRPARIQPERVRAREVRDQDRVDLGVRRIRIAVRQPPDPDVALPVHNYRLLR